MALALALLVGILPMSVFAAEAPDTDYLFFATDRHTNTTVIGNIINNMESVIGDNKLEYLGLGGDMVGSGNSHPAYNSSTVLAEVTGATTSLSAKNVDIVAGIHDMNVTDDSGIVLPYKGGCGLLYEGDKYYVYGVEEYCISDDSDEDNWSAQAQAFVDWANGSTIDKSKVIIVLSHYPLHAKRDDNDGAYYWHQALNTVATGSASGDSTVERDIVFFHGHNHTVDSQEYVYDVGDSMSIQNGSSTTSDTIYYTYATAGYLNQNSKATLMSITDSTITLTKYTTSGSGTAMTTVERVATEEAVTPKTLAVTGVIEYTVGDTVKNPSEVVITYSDGSTKSLSKGEISLSDLTCVITDEEGTVQTSTTFATAGKYNLTYSYTEGGQTASATLAVTVKTGMSTVYTYDDVMGKYIEATALGLTGITATYVYNDYTTVLADTFTEEYVALNIALEGHTDGNEVTYSFAYDTTIPLQNLGLYYIDENNQLTAIPFKIVTEDEIQYIQFTTTYVGVFAYGTVVVPDGYELSHITVEYEGATKYLVGDSFDMVNILVTAVYTKADSDDFVCQLSIKGYGVDDGYEYTAPDMTTAGTKTITVTYGGKSASFDIEVYNRVFPDANTGVSVEVTVSGATAIQVETVTSGNGTVTSAVGHLLTDYVAYDISLTGYNDGESVTVTLPVPEGVENPVVYYVSDDGKTVQNMGATKNADGTVSFETDHFSIYVVGESTEIEVPDPTTATATGTTTTKTTKYYYVLTSTLTSGSEYLIVNSNSASTTTRYTLTNNNGSVGRTGVTVMSGDIDGDGDNETYIELEDATDELWTVGGSSSYTFQNGEYYLRCSSGSLSLSNSTSTNWSWSSSNNRLSYSSGSTYYLRYRSNSWSVSTSSNRVYLYVKTPVEVETTTTTTGDYSIAGTPAEVEKVVVSGTTVTLGSTLTFVPESGTTTTTDTSTTATYAVVDGGDPNGIISDISGNTVTFTGKYGKALVKVSYTGTVGETSYTVDNYIVVTAKSPYYEITIKDENDKTVSGTTVSLKGITSGQTVDLSAIVNLITDTGSSEVTGAVVEWAIPEEYQNIASVDQNGVVTLKGVDGSFYVMVTYTDDNDNDYTAGVNFSVTTSLYSVPSDGTSDFPEYPNEGAVRFDKTATAVGNFSETGITKVELSMTGVPYTTDNAMDVVVMLDMTGSMSENGIAAAEAAAKAFVATIVKNADGTYNNNRVAVYQFNTNGVSTYFDLQTISSDAELTTAQNKISGTQASGGTPFDTAAKHCHDILAAAKTDGIGNNRQQFCVFMSDGGPTTYYGSDEKTYYGGNNNSGDVLLTSCMTGYTSSDSADWSFTLPTEYYTDDMKADGVTVYTVGLLLQTAPSNPAPYSSMTDSTYDSTTDSLTSIGSHYYFTSAILKQMASDESKYIDIFTVDNADNATAKFTAIAESILEAATNVVVQDKISDDYTMVFDIPTGSYTDNNDAVADALQDQEFYIEFLEYALDANHERTTSTSKLKLYLGIDSTTNTYYAASDNAGTKFADPVFTAVATDDAGNATEKGYWSTVDSTYTADDDEIVINVNGTYYKFIADGSGAYNMTSGAYAYGTIDATTSTSQDLVIVTPYFAYSAATRMLCWTVEKLTTVEYALSYFLFLDQSSTDIGKETEVAAGPYETNDWATLTYTNFNGNDCQQEFPVPQMTWNGAQVSYVFYLVNAAGQPINKSGQVVDFANATFITDVFTHTVVWNGDNAVEELNVSYLATDLLPDAYKIYDENAKYTIHVYQTESGQTVFDYFIIDGSAQGIVNANGNTVTSIQTTKVYNTKAGTKYADYGIYSAEAVGTKFETTDADGNTVEIITTKQASLDYSDTTVAFAVVWEPKLVEDTVVVDFGLDVLINVVQNDNLQNTVGGIGLGADAYGSTEMNTGVSTTSKLGTAALTVGGHTISIENENQIRFHQNNMVFTDPVVFYYESEVEFYEGSDKQTGYMYSKVTVIPATTVYYEDEYVTLKTYTSTGTTDADGNTVYSETDGWDTNSVSASATQDQDRPGASQISDDIDADNLYGYDSAYSSMSQFSMGAAAMTSVSAGKYATATFTFYGTGFDIISLTSAATGIITINVYQGATATGTAYVSETVDTYYGYERQYWNVTYTYTDGTWTVTAETQVDTMGTVNSAPENPAEGVTYTTCEIRWSTTATDNSNALYQVPVMKIGDGKTTDALPYDQYTVVITATYIPFLDHNKTDTGYNFYLDAIRIYNPAGDGVIENDDGTEDTTIRDAYIADGEGWPSYFEVRDQIIDKATFDSLNSETISGVVFIDGGISAPSVSDYTNYGPNNEVYLDAEQAIAFKLTATAAVGDVAKIRLAVKSVGGAGKIEVYGVDDEGNITACLDETISTATDMYYDITELNGMNVVIKNAALSADTSNNAIISITNVKVTYTAEQTVTEEQFVETASVNVGNNDLETASYSLMSLRSSAPAIYTMATTAEETVENTETETYLFSVSADGVAAVLMSLNVEEEEVEPEEPSEPEIPETPEEPEEPSEPEVPEEEEKPGKPEDHRKPGKGHHGKGHGKYHRKKFDDQPGHDHGRRGH